MMHDLKLPGYLQAHQQEVNLYPYRHFHFPMFISCNLYLIAGIYECINGEIEARQAAERKMEQIANAKRVIAYE